jgi:alpha-galactosidase
VIAAPLMAGNDVRTMTPAVRAILTDKDVLAIDQDPLGRQGFRALAEESHQIEIWAKELSNKEWAVCALNTGRTAADLSVEWGRLSFLQGVYDVRDLWSKQAAGDTSKPYTARVEAHDVMLFRLTPRS